MVWRLLEASETLLEQKPRSDAFRRRAVSTAYYAVFHALAEACADCLLPSTDRRSAAYERVYRALDHGPLKSVFDVAPLNESASLRAIGVLVVRLQSERHRADYMPPRGDVFPVSKTKDLIDQARQAVEIESLGDTERPTLTTHLLFRTRPS
jgi:uncharacterized protein (UPF0332 family)